MNINPLARRQIRALIEEVLREADAAGRFPTPLERVAEVAGVREVIDTTDLPSELVSHRPRAWRRILGAYLFRAETAFVDLSQPRGRATFVKAHETGHRIIPWHRASFLLDDEEHLFRDTEELLELEANLAATLLIFQGSRFHERALDYERSLKTPIALADDFGASMHATIRYYVEHHPDPIAMVISGRFTRRNGSVPVWSLVESPNFRSRFGGLREHFPTPELALTGQQAGALGELASSALRSLEPVVGARIRVGVEPAAWKEFDAEAFFNQRCLFVMFAPPRKLRLGRRLELAAG